MNTLCCRKFEHNRIDQRFVEFSAGSTWKLYLYSNAVLAGSVCLSTCLSVRALQKPPSRCQILKLSTYSESSWHSRGYKTICTPKAPQIFISPQFLPLNEPQILFFIFTAADGGTQRAKLTPPMAAVSRVLTIYINLNIIT